MIYRVPAGGVGPWVSGGAEAFVSVTYGDIPPALFLPLKRTGVFRGVGWIIIEDNSANVLRK